ncbi:MAG: hypothetical protein R2865_08050 [Deinococcales bacterium]
MTKVSDGFIKLFWGRQRPILVSANDNGIITLRDISQQKVMSRIRYPNSLQSLRLSEDDSNVDGLKR